MTDSREWERPLYLEMIRQTKIASKRTWKDIDSRADIDKSTREQWFNGRTREPPLVGVVKLCAELGIPADRLFAAVIDGEASSAAAVLESVEVRLERVEATLAALRERDLRLQAAEAELRRLTDEAQGRQDPGAETGTQ